MSLKALLNTVLGLLTFFIIRIWVTRKIPLGPLPPGPKPKPIVGNIADLPPPGVQDWMHWLKHKSLYGRLKKLRLTVVFPFVSLT
jgi:predicted alpha/beta hydrolase